MIAPILDKVRDGERITDEEAVELLRSRDLVAVGRVANEAWLVSSSMVSRAWIRSAIHR